jgi:oxygen-independent coproporphyrinogen-3 oxidase
VKPKYIASDTDPYFSALEQEIDIYAQLLGPRKKVRGFDIGGGTPSIVDTRYISRILDKIDNCFSLPDTTRISIETTPKIAHIDPLKIRDYHDMGIKRISM